jgi:hypothetical protein
MTGGIARTVSRNPTPASQRDMIAISFCLNGIGLRASKGALPDQIEEAHIADIAGACESYSCFSK